MLFWDLPQELPDVGHQDVFWVNETPEQIGLEMMAKLDWLNSVCRAWAEQFSGDEVQLAHRGTPTSPFPSQPRPHLER